MVRHHAALKSRRLWLVAAFLFLYAFAPGFGTPLYYYMTDTLRFSQAYIGTLGAIAAAGWIAGALLHRWLMRRIDAENLLYLSILLGVLSAGSFLLLTDELSAAIVNFANGLAQMIATIASLTLAAQCVPRRAEGFAFAGLMSVSNLAESARSMSGRSSTSASSPATSPRSSSLPRRRRRSPPCWSRCSTCARIRWT